MSNLRSTTIWGIAVMLLLNAGSASRMFAQNKKLNKNIKQKVGVVETPVKKINVEVDSVKMMIDASLKGVLKGTIEILRKPMFKTINVTKDHPVILAIEKSKKDGCEKIETYIDLGTFDEYKISIYPSSTITAVGDVQIGMSLPGSASDGAWAKSGDIVGFISSGEHRLEAAFSVNGKLFYFENTKVTFGDNIGPGNVSENSVCCINNVKYRFENGKWVKKEI